MPAPQTWRDTLATIEDDAAHHTRETAAMSIEPEYSDRTISMMHMFRGEDDHVPARDIKSSLRRHLEKRLEKLEKHPGPGPESPP